MIAYASRTGTKRNLAELRRLGWRLMVSATGVHRTEGFRYCIDNGAWTAHQQGTPFDSDAFQALLDKHGAGADFVTLPDIVAGGMDSFEFSANWWTELDGLAPLVLPVQDGMEEEEVRRFILHTPGLGVFIGGSDDFKEPAIVRWSEWTRANGIYLHVGRVNSQRRIRICADCGVDSFDGTNATIYSVNTAKLERARRERTLWE